MILKRGLIPTQDDPENMRGRGGLRPDADTDAERRATQPGADPGVPQSQSGHRIHRPKQGRAVSVCAAGAGSARVPGARQEAAWEDSGLPEQGYRIEFAAADAVNPQVPPGRSGGTEGVPPAAISHSVHQSRCGAAGEIGWDAWLVERAGDGADPKARIR